MDPVTIGLLTTTIASVLVNIVQFIIGKVPKCMSACNLCNTDVEIKQKEEN